MWPLVKKKKETPQPPTVWLNPEPGRIVNLTRAWTLSIERSEEKPNRVMAELDRALDRAIRSGERLEMPELERIIRSEEEQPEEERREVYYIYAKLGPGQVNRVPVAYVGDESLAEHVLDGIVRALGEMNFGFLTMTPEMRARVPKEPDEPRRLWFHWFSSHIAVNLAQVQQIKVHFIDHLPPGGAAAIAEGKEVTRLPRGVYAELPDGEEVYLGPENPDNPRDDADNLTDRAQAMFEGFVAYMRPYGHGRYQGSPFAPS